jgi:hypothetical protein
VILASVVDTRDLWEVAWVSTVSATILVIATSLAIVGAARANTARREGNPTGAALFVALTILAGAVCAGGVVLAVSVMLSKG